MKMLKGMLGILRRGPLVYPFLFALYPILFLWSNNIDELSFSSSRADLLLPMAISVIFTLILLAVSWAILRNWRSAGLFVAFILLLFFSYGHVLELLSGQGNPEIAKNRYLVIIWPVIFVAGGLLLLRYRTKLRTLTNPLNVMALTLIMFTLPNIISYSPPSAALSLETDVKRGPAAESNPIDAGTLPDIYYITAEGYAGARNLERYLNYDNTPFIDYLKSRSFFVASESNANYGVTRLSLSSAVNMEYHGTEVEKEANYYRRRLQNNKAMRFAREHGYRVLYLSDKWPAGRKDLGDTYFGCGARRLSIHTEGFTDVLLHTTALQPILTKFHILEPGQKAERVCQFFQLAKSKDIAGPKVVVTHLSVPGFPFLLGPDGEPVAGSASSAKPESYLNQVVWTNKMLEWLIDRLLSDPDYSPVIIIQGDHGEAWLDLDLDEEEQLRRTFGIMNAYHLPDGGNRLLYPSISPVNTFRIIFNYYLGADFALLEDRSYLESGKRDFVEVTDAVSQLTKD